MTSAARLFLMNGVLRRAIMAGGWLPLSVRLVVDLKLSAAQLLLMGTSMEVATLLGEVPTGVVADVFSRKWSVIVGGLLIFGAQVASGVVDVWALYLVTQFVWGIGWTFLSGAEIAWVTDEVGSAELVEPLLLRRGQLEFAAVIVGIIVFGGATLVVPLNVSVMFAGALGLAWTTYLAVVMKETGFTPTRTHRMKAFTRTLADGARFTWNHRALRAFGLALLLGGMAAEAMDRLEVRRLEDLGLSESISPVLVLGAVMIGQSALGGFVLWRFGNRLEGRNVVLGFSVILASVGVVAFLLAHVPVLGFAAVMLVVQGGLLSATDPLVDTWTNALAPTNARSTVHSFIGQTRSLGEIVGGVSLAFVASGATLPVAWTAAAGLFMCAAMVASTARHHWDGAAARSD